MKTGSSTISSCSGDVPAAVLRRGLVVALACVGGVPGVARGEELYRFSAPERSFLEGFLIAKLPAPLRDPSNRYGDDLEAARLGHRLFFDGRLSVNGGISCAHCHRPEHHFTDGRNVGVGLGELKRNTPSVVGTAYSPWLYWDGRKDSLWSQALEPIESPHEHGLGRVEVARRVLKNYRDAYRAVFGKPPNLRNRRRFPASANPNGDPAGQKAWRKMRARDRRRVNEVFANVGKALMAYQRRLLPTASRFDRFVAAVNAQANGPTLERLYSRDEVVGLRLFMGRANCASCHNGPLFTNFEFHNVGAPEPRKEAVDLGRSAGVLKVKEDEFNCLSTYSDASSEDCPELLFLKTEGMELIGAFKTPSLRDVAETAPYMQSGQLSTLVDVVNHYNKPTPPFFDPEQHQARPHFDIMPLGLDETEVGQLVAFLKTLTSETRSAWMRPPR